MIFHGKHKSFWHRTDQFICGQLMVDIFCGMSGFQLSPKLSIRQNGEPLKRRQQGDVGIGSYLASRYPAFTTSLALTVAE